MRTFVCGCVVVVLFASVTHAVALGPVQTTPRTQAAAMSPSIPARMCKGISKATKTYCCAHPDRAECR
jgi:hypothetical protein